jgi:hypothetical protein
MWLGPVIMIVGFTSRSAAIPTDAADRNFHAPIRFHTPTCFHAPIRGSDDARNSTSDCSCRERGKVGLGSAVAPVIQIQDLLDPLAYLDLLGMARLRPAPKPPCS